MVKFHAKLIFSDGQELEVDKEYYLKTLTYEGGYSGDSESLVRSVTSGILNVELLNIDKIFTNINENSPYKDVLNKDVIIDLYKNDIFYNRYFVENFSTPINSKYTTSTITAYDRLTGLLDKDVTDVQDVVNITLKEYIEKVLLSLGVEQTKINISTSLTDVIDYPYTDGSKLSDILNGLIPAYNLYIYVMGDVINVIRRYEGVVDTSEVTFDDDDITGIETVVSFKSNCNVLKVGYNNYEKGSLEAVHTLNGVTLKVGLNEVLNNSMENLHSIETVQVDLEELISIEDYNYTQNKIDYYLDNKFKEEKTVDIIAYGYKMNQETAYVTESDDTTTKAQEVSIESTFITSINQAKEVSTLIWERVKKTDNYLVLNSYQDNNNYEVGKKIKITSSLLEAEKYGIIHDISIGWSGGTYIKARLGIEIY